MKKLTVATLALANAVGAVAFGEDFMNQTQATIPGYRLGDKTLPKAPISMDDLKKIQQSLLFTDEDVKYLRMSKEILAPQVEQILDVWYGFVGSHNFLLDAFVDLQTKQPDTAYLAAVRKRFGQWILDTASANYDQAWLDYQIEIGRRHHRSGKNKADNVKASANVPYRYVPALIIPITTTLKPFLAKGGASPEDVEKMHAAWVKSVTLQVVLWSYPYVKDGDF